jgi:hypothetical protein
MLDGHQPMDAIKQFLKGYRPAVGPALAFVFGFLVLFFKHQVDQWTAKWRLSRRLRNLERVVATSGPPETFFPGTSLGATHADEARNRTNLARFYSRLLALKPLFDSLVDPVAECGSAQQIAQLHAMKWWFDITLREVETWRGDQNWRMENSHFQQLRSDWQHLQEAAMNPEAQLEYLSRRRSE